MVNTSSEEPFRFALLIGSYIAMLRPTRIEEDIQSMKNNMIGNGKGLQEELVKLASMHLINDRDVYIIYCKEFCDEFNPHATNKTNNSVILHTFSTLPCDSTIDSSEFTCPIAVVDKYKNNIINETSYVDSINDLTNPSNKKLFYCKRLRKFIHVVRHSVGCMVDQPGKSNYTNNPGGNSE